MVAARSELQLGPAHVLEVLPTGVRVRLESGQMVEAGLALAAPYTPCAEDVVLVIAHGERSWVIGVIDGRGTSALRFQGDVELHAVGGTVKIHGDRGLKLSGPQVELTGTEIRLVADSVVQKMQTLYQRVRELISVHAKRSHTIVDESAFSKAKSQTMLTEEAMCINGKEIHLG